MSEELRRVIRGILLEELAAQEVNPIAERAPEVRVEEVDISTDQDLARFVRRIMALSGSARAELESGRHVFRLRRARPPSPAGPALSRSGGGGTVAIDRGLITEKQVRGFPADVSVLKISGGARLTPLATDALRRAGIKIEKVTS